MTQSTTPRTHTVGATEKYHAGRNAGKSSPRTVLICLAGHPALIDERPRHSLSWSELQARRENEEHGRFLRGVVFGLLLVTPFWVAVAMAVRP